MSDSIVERYQKAEQLLPWNLASKLGNLSVEPHWIDDRRFWFKRDRCDGDGGYEFVLVDSEALSLAPLFDHRRLANQLQGYLGKKTEAQCLPLTELTFTSAKCGHFTVMGAATHRRHFLLYLDDGNEHIEEDSSRPSMDDSLSTVSPDGQWDVVCRNYNLVLRDRASGEERELTTDGSALYGYGNYAEDTLVSTFEGQSLPPAVRWSEDGRFIAVQRIDKRPMQGMAMPLVQSVPDSDDYDGAIRPEYKPYTVNIPGDSRHELGSLCTIDLETGYISRSDRPPVPASTGAFIDCWGVQWGQDQQLYHTEWSSDRQQLRLVAFDPLRSTSRILLSETNQQPHTYLYPGPSYTDPCLFRILAASNEFIWYSHTSGWGHLYLYDLITGRRKHAITEGNFVVTELYYVDPVARRVYFSACGREPDRNPYYSHFYRVNLDGSELVLLTPEASQHDRVYPAGYAPYKNLDPSVSSLSPDSRVFVDTLSRVDQPSISILRSAQDGRKLMHLSHCDDRHVSQTPYRYPESFNVKAADGKTDIWGVIHKPSDFDEHQQYPVILALYGGPHCTVVPKRFAEIKSYLGTMGRTLAELGFVVVTLDPRGTPYRSKRFIDQSFGNLQNGGGMDDQVVALKQLAKCYPWMDLQRVGITGHSSGGFATVRGMLTHSDFFKVGVSSAGVHDHRLYVAGWVEALQGSIERDNFKAQSNLPLAGNLQGKLLLVQGDMDTNVHIAHTLRLTDQFIKHNRDFDLLILPNRQHRFSTDRYFIRRVWDYFVEHLLERNPPKNYSIESPSQ